jgi:hypothetical protein
MIRVSLLLLLSSIPAYAQIPPEVIEVQTGTNTKGQKAFTYVYRSAVPQTSVVLLDSGFNAQNRKLPLPGEQHNYDVRSSEDAGYIRNIAPEAYNTTVVTVLMSVKSKEYPISRVYQVRLSLADDAEDDHDTITMPAHGVLTINPMDNPTVYVRNHGFLVPESDGEGAYTVNLGVYPKDFTYCVPWGDRIRCWSK